MTYQNLAPGIYFEYSAPGENLYLGITQVLEVSDYSACFTDLVCFSSSSYDLAFKEWHSFENLLHLRYTLLTTSDLSLDQLRTSFPEYFI